MSLIKNTSYINGEWLSTSNTFNVTNPANGCIIAEVTNANAEHTRQAIEAAYQALPAWRATPIKERARRLRNWFNLLMDYQDELATILTSEQGKPLAEAKAEIAYGANYIEWFAEESKRIYGDVIPSTSIDKRVIITREPIGVVAAITPWNFPNAMIARKAAPALAAGCTFVIRPASETPLSALALAALAEQASIPAGVFNVIAGTDAQGIGAQLTGHPLVRKFTFTGSTTTGKILLKQCADTVKKTSMELGGNAPFIVFDDADIDAAVEGALISKFRNAGQTCVCSNRLLIQADIIDEFTARFSQRVKQLTIGDGSKDNIDIGPMINKQAVEKTDAMVKESTQQGAKLLCGGQTLDNIGPCFYAPTILTDVQVSMPIAREEIFGPVAPIITFDTEEQAIAIANHTEAGLAAYIYTRDIGRVWHISEALEYGMVGVNEGIISNEMAPFGGIKESGMGREGSRYGIDDYTEIKYICMGGI